MTTWSGIPTSIEINGVNLGPAQVTRFEYKRDIELVASMADTHNHYVPTTANFTIVAQTNDTVFWNNRATPEPQVERCRYCDCKQDGKRVHCVSCGAPL